MASGAILGTCPICGDVIWEDEWDIFDDSIIHERCKRKAAIKAARMSTEQYDKLCETRKVENEIKDLKKDMEDTFKYYKNQITELENKLEKIKIQGGKNKL